LKKDSKKGRGEKGKKIIPYSRSKKTKNQKKKKKGFTLHFPATKKEKLAV